LIKKLSTISKKVSNDFAEFDNLYPKSVSLDFDLQANFKDFKAAQETSFSPSNIEEIIAPLNRPPLIREVRKLIDGLNKYANDSSEISLEKKAQNINNARQGIANNVSNIINS